MVAGSGPETAALPLGMKNHERNRRVQASVEFAPSPHPSPPSEGERVPEGRERGGEA